MWAAGTGSCRVKRFFGQAHHQPRSPCRWQQNHRLLKLGGHLANDVNALGFERPQMSRNKSALMRPSERGCQLNRLILVQRIIGLRFIHSSIGVVALSLIITEERRKGVARM